MGAQTTALPQLQAALKKLYDDRDKTKGLLLWSQYPGLSRAIAAAADDAVQDLDEDARSALPTLVQALAEIRSRAGEELSQASSDGASITTARVADLSQSPFGALPSACENAGC